MIYLSCHWWWDRLGNHLSALAGGRLEWVVFCEVFAKMVVFLKRIAE